MFKTIINAFKIKEVRRKIIITLLLLLIYRVGCWLPVPGINSEVFKAQTGDNGFLSFRLEKCGNEITHQSSRTLNKKL